MTSKSSPEIVRRFFLAKFQIFRKVNVFLDKKDNFSRGPLSLSDRLFGPTNFQQNSRNSRFLGNRMSEKSSKFLKIPDF